MRTFPLDTHNERSDLHYTGGRVGTFYTSLEVLARVLGPPQAGSLDGKTTTEWLIQTPHGVAAVYDYVWNDGGEWSIGAGTTDVCDDLRRAFLEAGFTVEFEDAKTAWKRGFGGPAYSITEPMTVES